MRFQQEKYIFSPLIVLEQV